MAKRATKLQNSQLTECETIDGVATVDCAETPSKLTANNAGRIVHNEKPTDSKRRSKHRQFRDVTFSPSHSAFDRLKPVASKSSFHGFYTLFWFVHCPSSGLSTEG